jgi:protein SCO1/2
MPIPKWARLALIGLLVIGAGAAGALALWPRHTFSGVVLDPPASAPDFTLTDESGQAFTLSALRGQWVLLSYGYTSCPDVCPATLNNLKKVKQALGPLAEKVRVVFVSVDPERDTAAIMDEYVHHFGADFKGLTGAPDQVAAAAQGFGVKYAKKYVESANGYLVSHSAFVYLIDPDFRWRLSYPFGVAPEAMAADLQYLISHPSQEQ